MAGTPQAAAAGLVPQGFTGVTFFPATAAQSLQTVSVIFAESLLAPVGKRKKRSEQKFENRGYQGSNVTIRIKQHF